MLHKKYLLIVAAFAGVSAMRSQPNEDSNEDLLIDAVIRNDVAEVDRLLQAGTDVNDDAWGTTPLIEAILAGREGFVRKLIQAGADVDLVSRDRANTPLMEAVSTGSVGIMRELLLAGADANLAGPFGGTPMKKAIEAGNEGVIRELLLAGAKPLSDDMLHQILSHLEVDAPGEFQKRVQSIKRLQQSISRKRREALGQFAEQMDIEHDVPRDVQRLIIRDVLGTAEEQLPEFQKRR